MLIDSFQLDEEKAVIRMHNKICENSQELLSSVLFREVLRNFIHSLERKRSRLLRIFPNGKVSDEELDLLVKTFQFLIKLPADLVPKVLEPAAVFLQDKPLLGDFVEQLYNYWRRLHRALICDSIDDRLDERPYRTFNRTVETLTHVVRRTYRDVMENITGNHPRVYRQVSAGAEISAIALPMELPFKSDQYEELNKVSVIRQILIYPPMIFNSPINKRKGVFEQVHQNPIAGITLDPNGWLCYPAKVGSLVVLIYFTMHSFELGFSLSNLFELADDKDLQNAPDAVYLFGVDQIPAGLSSRSETVFYDDPETGMLVAAVPNRDEFGYFGYLKKMTLTLHNIIMMKRGRLPYHGAMFSITLQDKPETNVLVIGDSGAGKSETLEALRTIAGDDMENLTIIADDMGSMVVDEKLGLLGYGTEMGAFVRLDDLQNGYALGQIDRTIIMNPDQVNARVVIPVTKFEDVVKGYPVHIVLYANNYEEIDAAHPVIQRFHSAEEALSVFRSGAVMSKGTTNTSGLVHTYFANIFGPPQYRELHEELAEKYFKAMFDQGIYVGEMRTRLGVPGLERTGPLDSALALLDLIRNRS